MASGGTGEEGREMLTFDEAFFPRLRAVHFFFLVLGVIFPGFPSPLPGHLLACVFILRYIYISIYILFFTLA